MSATCHICRVQSRRPTVLLDVLANDRHALVVDLPCCARCLSTALNTLAAVGLIVGSRQAPPAAPASGARTAAGGSAGDLE